MILLVDSYDSFTYNLSDYLQRCGASIHVMYNDEPSNEWKQKAYQGVVLSPGPGTPQSAGRLLEILDFFVGKIPILGVCLGHQAIGQYFGAELTKAHAPMHGKLSTIHTIPDVIFQSLPTSFKVVRYHSLILRNTPPSLITLASTDQSEIMAIRHHALPIWGLQFHPEAWCTEYGLEMINNWVQWAYQFANEPIKLNT